MVGKQYKLKIESLTRQHMGKSAVAFFMVYQCKLIKYNNDGEEMHSTDVYFPSSTKRLFSMEEFDEHYIEAMGNINEKFGKYLGESSGWVLGSISAINLNIARYDPIRVASYTPTPSSIAVKKAVVNIKIKDKECFLFPLLYIGFSVPC